MRTSNPALNDRAFSTAVLDERSQRAAGDPSASPFVGARTMSVEGVAYKTLALLFLTIASALATWYVLAPETVTPPLVAVTFVTLIGLGIATGLRPRIAVVTGPLYALASGAFVGTITGLLEQAYPGIAIQAGAATLVTLLAMLVAYLTGLIKVTKTFIRVVVTATLGIVLLYAASIGMSLFGARMPVLHDASPLGILVSVAIIAVASMNLVLDFHIIERAVTAGSDRRLEWYGAFALLVTLVWLYIEFLRLLSKLRR